jgi:hypothetical protein
MNGSREKSVAEALSHRLPVCVSLDDNVATSLRNFGQWRSFCHFLVNRHSAKKPPLATANYK